MTPFDQGGKETFITKDIMLEGIKHMAMVKRHAIVHVRNLHNTRQEIDESIKTYAAASQLTQISR